MTLLITLPLRLQADVVGCRQRARQIARLLGFDAHDLVHIPTAVSERCASCLRAFMRVRSNFTWTARPPSSWCASWDDCQRQTGSIAAASDQPVVVLTSLSRTELAAYPLSDALAVLSKGLLDAGTLHTVLRTTSLSLRA
jgi:hypothetical protein